MHHCWGAVPRTEDIRVKISQEIMPPGYLVNCCLWVVQALLYVNNLPCCKQLPARSFILCFQAIFSVYERRHKRAGALDLLGRMLAINPKERISAADALKACFIPLQKI